MIDVRKTGKFIAQCRHEKNLTQKELGDRLNVTDRAVSKWENGRSFSRCESDRGDLQRAGYRSK